MNDQNRENILIRVIPTEPNSYCLMKYLFRLFYTTTFFLLISSFSGFSQDSCKVLKYGIDSAYAGVCKKGLAHGIGEAWGDDHYYGEFKKGLPHGEGIYEYYDGSVYKGSFSKGLKHGYGEYIPMLMNVDTSMKGMWENNVYIEKVHKGGELDYSVVRNEEIDRYKAIWQGENKRISIRLNNYVSSKPELFNILLYGTSGRRSSSKGIYYFEDVVYPFTLQVSYTKWDRLGYSTKMVEFEIEIYREGEWRIELH